MSRLWRVRVTGPLEVYAVGFRVELESRGYSPWTVIFCLESMEHLSRWLVVHGLDPCGLTAVEVERFVWDRCGGGRDRRRSPRGLVLLLGYLRELGVVSGAVPPVAGGPFDGLLAEFAEYLVGERGLAAGTVCDYRGVAGRFLSARVSQREAVGAGLMALTAGEVSSFVVDECGRRSVGSVKNVVTALRALLRFLHVRGRISSPLADAVPAVAGWCGRSHPRVLHAHQVALLLGGCDRRTAVGRRDYAMLVLLARLGLRAGEVAALRVDDLDWRAGEILIRGKGNRHERLPLPVDVGQAIAGYCRRGRREGACRSVFVHARAPYAGLSASAVSKVVERACARVGLPAVGAHLLRHAAATALRGAGAPLAEIGGVLRHVNPATTARYGSVEVQMLAAVARPWPTGAR